VFSTCFGHPSVHPQDDLYMQFYGISFVHPYKQSDRWQDMLGTRVYEVVVPSTFKNINVKWCTLLVLIT